MFDIKKEVPSLELCKKLKELGFPQGGGGWYWIQDDEKTEWVLKFFKEIDSCPHIMLSNDPDGYKGDCEFNGECTIWVSNTFWSCEFLHLIKAPTCRELIKWIYREYRGILVEELAKDLVRLKKDGCVDFNKEADKNERD